WTWLYRIVLNACLRQQGWRSRHRVESLGRSLRSVGGWERTALTDQGEAEDGCTGVLRAEARAQVRACIESLPAPLRTVLLLRDIEGFDTDRAAQLLGASRGAVKTRLHRARVAL